MKRRPVRLPEADTRDVRELFPDSLYHPSATSAQAEAPEALEHLLGEQSLLLERARVQVANSREYLRSPPRRLRIISESFHENHRQTADAASSQTPQLESPPEPHAQSNTTAAHRKPLPPLHSGLSSNSTDNAAVSAAASAPAGVSSLNDLVDVVVRFFVANPEVSVQRLVERLSLPLTPATEQDRARESVGSEQERAVEPVAAAEKRGRPDRLVTVAGGAVAAVRLTTAAAAAASSFPASDSNNVSRAGASQASSRFFSGSVEDFQKASGSVREELIRECLPFVPRLVLRNVDESDMAESEDPVGGKSHTGSHSKKSPAELSGLLPTTTFRPWKGNAVVVFIDISGYSKVTTALAPKGAHALSHAVNSYLEPIIQVVRRCGGDIVKFAGDAILAVWAPNSPPDPTSSLLSSTPSTPFQRPRHADDDRAVTDDGERLRDDELFMLQHEALRATACCVELQRDHAWHKVEDADGLVFSLHIGIVSGPLETSVFFFPHAKNTELAFHSVSGAPLQEVGGVVDSAKSKETCVSASVHQLLLGARVAGLKVSHVPFEGGEGHHINSSESSGCYRVDELNLEQAAIAIERFEVASSQRRGSNAGAGGGLEPDEAEDAPSDETRLAALVPYFIHPALLRRFASASSNTAAEMRFLAVMFVSKIDTGIDLNDWFTEVQMVLDRHRCAIVKVIDDDKGVHLIAAAGLFQSERNACLSAVEACRELAVRETGCVTGVAAGLTFCGVVGHTQLACRWDVTSAACVRSCRLMQQAMALRPPGDCFVDTSVLESIGNRSLLRDYPTALSLKGSPDPVSVFALAGSFAQPAWTLTAVTAQMSETCHAKQREQLLNFFENRFSHNHRRAVVILSGTCGVGKAMLATSVLDRLHVTAVQHECFRGSSPFSVAKTLADWFSYYQSNDKLTCLAHAVREAFAQEHIVRTRKLLLELISTAIEERVRIALVIKQAQLIDPTSLAFTSQFLRRRNRRGYELSGEEVSCSVANADGTFLIVLCATPTYDALSVKAMKRTIQSLVQDDTRDDAQDLRENVLLMHLPALEPPESRDVVSKVFSWELDDSAFDRVLEFCSGIPSLITAFARHVMAQRPYLTQMSREGLIYLPQSGARKMDEWHWQQIFPSMPPQLLVLYDAVPTRQKILLRVVAVLSVRRNDDVLYDVVQHVVSKFLRHVDVAAFRADVKSLMEHDLLIHHGGPPACSKAKAALDSTGASATAAPNDAATAVGVGKHADESESPVGGVASFTASLSLASVALRDSICQTLSPDHRRLILRTAAKYLHQCLDAHVAGGMSWCCRGLLLARTVQALVESQQGNDAQTRTMLQQLAAMKDSPLASDSATTEATSTSSVLSSTVVCEGEHDVRFQSLRRDLLRQARLIPEPTQAPLQLRPISLDVVFVKNYFPPIGIGSSLGSILLELCFWVRTAYVLVMRQKDVPEKAVTRSNTLVQSWSDICKKAVAVVKRLSAGSGTLAAGETGDEASSFAFAAAIDGKQLEDDEALLRSVIRKFVQPSASRNLDDAAASAEQACQLLKEFLEVRIATFSSALQQCVSVDSLACLGLPTKAELSAKRVRSPAEANRKATLTALVRALSVYQSARAPVRVNSSGTQQVDEERQIETFHRVLMALATSGFSTRSHRFTLTMVRDCVLKEKKAAPIALLSCVVMDYAAAAS